MRAVTVKVNEEAEPDPIAVPSYCCSECETRWDDVQFYGLPGSALCGKCPKRAEWTGRLFSNSLPYSS